MGKSQKNYMSIKSKLMAAVAMLLVASFMVVSSTYAWFTLSTAPEITGVKTSVGANGNLEIALLTSSTENDVEDLATLALNVQTTTGGLTDLVDKNKTWGNIVEISNKENENPYGLNEISLVPSRLALASATTLKVATPLSVPVYGADGRISELKSEGTVYGTWNGTSFVNGGTGVRALGTISSMTQQELDYRAARLAYGAAINNAFNLANNTLQANKQGMINTVMSVAMGTTDTYDITTLRTMINALYPTAEGSKGVVEYLEEARKNIVKALYIFATSTETNYASPIDVTFDETTGAPSIVTAAGDVEVPNWDTSSSLPVMKDYVGLVTKITSIKTALKTASDKIAEQQDATTVTDPAVVKAILDPLFNTTGVKIGSGENEVGIGELRTKLEKAGYADISMNNINAVLSWMQERGYIGEDGSVDAKMGEGSGVFADINQATGRAISATADFMVVIRVRMSTSVTETYAVTYATNADTVADISYPEKPQGAVTSSDLTDYYGYALDFAFRTNAKNSKLQLQTSATNRIYSEGGSEDTMGSGSVMRFKSLDTENFDEEDVANLMSSIRIVFVDDAGEIIAVAGAKTELVTEEDADGTQVQSTKVKYSSEVDGADTYVVSDIVLYDYKLDFADDESTTDVDESKTPGKITLTGVKAVDQKGATVLMSLEQNTATALSAYVYLDGDAVENGDVAAEAAQSMVGSINLQFSSDAELKPMEYSDLMNPTQNTEDNAQGSGN